MPPSARSIVVHLTVLVLALFSSSALEAAPFTADFTKQSAVLGYAFSKDAASELQTNTLEVADLDADGYLDIIVGVSGSSGSYGQDFIAFGDANGAFPTLVDLGGETTNTSDFVVADFSGDGKPDILAVYLDTAPLLFTNNGSRSFVGGAGIGDTPGSICAFAADFNADSKMDFILSSKTASGGSSRETRIYLNDGAGTFTVTADVFAGCSANGKAYGGGVAVGDVNGDGKQDIAIANDVGGTVYLALADGSFDAFTSMTFDERVAETYSTVGIADFKPGNGLNEIVMGSADGVGPATVGYYTPPVGQTLATFTKTYAPGYRGRYVGHGDMDGDGDLDLVIIRGGNVAASNYFNRIYVNDGSGSFSETSGPSFELSSLSSRYITWAVPADFNLDGKLDLALGTVSRTSGEGAQDVVLFNDAAVPPADSTVTQNTPEVTTLPSTDPATGPGHTVWAMQVNDLADAQNTPTVVDQLTFDVDIAQSDMVFGFRATGFDVVRRNNGIDYYYLCFYLTDTTNLLTITSDDGRMNIVGGIIHVADGVYAGTHSVARFHPDSGVNSGMIETSTLWVSPMPWENYAGTLSVPGTAPVHNVGDYTWTLKHGQIEREAQVDVANSRVTFLTNCKATPGGIVPQRTMTLYAKLNQTVARPESLDDVSIRLYATAHTIGGQLVTPSFSKTNPIDVDVVATQMRLVSQPLKASSGVAFFFSSEWVDARGNRDFGHLEGQTGKVFYQSTLVGTGTISEGVFECDVTLDLPTGTMATLSVKDNTASTTWLTVTTPIEIVAPGVPVVEDVSMTDCLWRGGETVWIDGIGLYGATLKFVDAFFAETPVTSVTIESDYRLSFVTPAMPGTTTTGSIAQNLIITGTDAAAPPIAFTFHSVIVTSISPDILLSNGNPIITISGRGFKNPDVTRVWLANNIQLTPSALTDTSFTISKLAHQVPPTLHLGYWKDLKVENVFGTAVISKGIGWVGPSTVLQYVSGIVDADDDDREVAIGSGRTLKALGSGLWEAGAAVELTGLDPRYGNDLKPVLSGNGASLLFDAGDITVPHLYRPTTLLIRSNSNSNSSVLNSGGHEAPYLPKLVRLSIDHGSEYGLETVVCEGYDMAKVDSVKFGDVSAAILNTGQNYVRVVTPQGTAGTTVDVTIADGSLPPSTLSAAWTYDTGTGTPPPATGPKIMSVYPPVVPVSGNAQDIWISGYNFDTVTGNGAVTVDGSSVTIIGRGKNFLKIQAKSSSEKIASITVKDTAGETDTSPNALTFTRDPIPGTPAPTVSVYEWNNPQYVLFTDGDRPILFGANITTGSVAGGETITLYGYKLGTASAIAFGATPAVTWGVVSSSELTVLVPEGAAAGKVALSVTTTGGSTGSIDYTYTGSRISAVSPDRGPMVGGNEVRITGAGFGDMDDTTVTFGFDNPNWGLVEATIQSVSSTEIVLLAPEYARSGKVDVIVTVNGLASTPAKYTYAALDELLIMAITPNTGNEFGGETVTITGQNLDKVVDVVFVNEGISYPQRYSHVAITHVDASTIRVVTPNHAVVLSTRRLPGAEDVIVSTVAIADTALPTGVTTHDTLEKGFTFIENEEFLVESFTTVGPATGEYLNASGNWQSKQFFANGAFFGAVESVTFGTAAPVTSFIQRKDTMLSCRVPANPTGLAEKVDLVFTLIDGTEKRFEDAFTYEETKVDVTSVTPSRGNDVGGEECVFVGENLGAVTQVFFGTAEATIQGGRSNTRFDVITPASPVLGMVDIRLVLSRGMPDYLITDGFEYLFTIQPTVDSVLNNAGPKAGGTTVTLIGQNLDLVTRVVFGAVNTPIGLQDAGFLQVVAPPVSAAGVVSLKLSYNGGVKELPDAFTYTDAGFVVRGFSPNSGVTAGGHKVTIAGFGMLTVTTVEVDGIAITPNPGGSDISIHVIMPAHVAGPVTLAVTDGTTKTLIGEFTYVEDPASVPQLQAISNRRGGLAGGDVINLVGARLGTVTSVTFGGVPASIQRVTNTVIEVRTPPRATPGTVDVSVSNGVHTATLQNIFTYVEGTNGGGGEQVAAAASLLGCSLASAPEFSPLLLFLAVLVVLAVQARRKRS